MPEALHLLQWIVIFPLSKGMKPITWKHQTQRHRIKATATCSEFRHWPRRQESTLARSEILRVRKIKAVLVSTMAWSRRHGTGGGRRQGQQVEEDGAWWRSMAVHNLHILWHGFVDDPTATSRGASPPSCHWMKIQDKLVVAEESNGTLDQIKPTG